MIPFFDAFIMTLSSKKYIGKNRNEGSKVNRICKY